MKHSNRMPPAQYHNIDPNKVFQKLCAIHSDEERSTFLSKLPYQCMQQHIDPRFFKLELLQVAINQLMVADADEIQQLMTDITQSQPPLSISKKEYDYLINKVTVKLMKCGQSHLRDNFTTLLTPLMTEEATPPSLMYHNSLDRASAFETYVKSQFTDILQDMMGYIHNPKSSHPGVDSHFITAQKKLSHYLSTHPDDIYNPKAYKSFLLKNSHGNIVLDYHAKQLHEHQPTWENITSAYGDTITANQRHIWVDEFIAERPDQNAILSYLIPKLFARLNSFNTSSNYHSAEYPTSKGRHISWPEQQAISKDKYFFKHDDCDHFLSPKQHDEYFYHKNTFAQVLQTLPAHHSLFKTDATEELIDKENTPPSNHVQPAPNKL